MNPAQTNDVIRWGIIGCGDVCEVKSGPAFQKTAGSTLAAVMRRAPEKAADYAKRHGVAKWYSDAGELIADPEVDAVYIATPPGSHMDYTLQVAAAGKPVYVEKPMARDHAECLRMIDASRAARNGAGVPLFVAYYRRCLPRYRRIQQLIADGRLGEIRMVNLTFFQRPNAQELSRETLPWRVIPELAGAGRFLDLASHALDVLDFLLGPIREVQGRAANQGKLYDVEDIVTGNWVHENGVIGSGTWCFTAHDRIDRCQIVGSKGVLTFEVIEGTPIELWTNDGRDIFDEPNPPHVQQPLIQTIVDELRGKGKSPSTGQSAARTSWVMDQMLSGYRRGRK